MLSKSDEKNSGCGCGGANTSLQGQQMVRPRFFAGQLLTEDDLQLLTDYVGHKSRLHNRFLFGDGVVCGLEVNCHPCSDGRVIVNPGYALDCCGNDLVLSCPETLDINAMVRDLRRDMLGGYDCGDPCSEENASTPVDTTTRTYCLYIRYCEQPIDPVMPYSTGDDCGRQVCEPSRVREEVKFELHCKPAEDASHPLLKKLCNCLGDLQDLSDVLQAAATLKNGAAAESLGTVLEKVYDWLIERLSKTAFLNDCTLRERVCAIKLPEAKDSNVDSDVAESLYEVFRDFLRDCICRAIMPSCEPCNDIRVLLACVQVEECKVTKVCNLVRKFVISPISVRYWLPPLQLFGNVSETLCCQTSTRNDCDNVWNQEIASMLKASFCGDELTTQTDVTDLIEQLRQIICSANENEVSEEARSAGLSITEKTGAFSVETDKPKRPAPRRPSSKPEDTTKG